MKLFTKQNCTFPNLLSLLRILILPVILVAYGRAHYLTAIVLLLVSGLTDIVDGYLARTFHQISELGKILDPIADKLTQFSVMLCLSLHNPLLIPVAVIIFVKEILMLIGATLVAKQSRETPYARWWGKMTTVILYATMGLFVLDGWISIPEAVQITAMSLSIACLAFSFFNYLLIYCEVRKAVKSEKEPDGSPSPKE